MNFKPIETDENVLVMPGAVVCGDVTVGEGTAFWFNSVCRAELQPIKIGKRCNIQDLALIHNKVVIGDDVSVGHCATVHGATIGELDDETLFYFESRGISRAQAENILARASIERFARTVDDEVLRAQILQTLEEELNDDA